MSIGIYLITKTRKYEGPDDKLKKGILTLMRPELPFAAVVCVVIGEIYAGPGFLAVSTLLLGFI
ncbi:MAG: hypothetical protein PWP56_1606 [Acetobacterium sp.]|nr:hypothetical protein [Acetobacterium sp.]